MTNVPYLLAGVCCNDFVLLAADKTAVAFGAVKISDDNDRGVQLGENLYIICAGDPGRVKSISSMAACQIESQKFQFGYDMKPQPALNFLSRTVANSLRSADPWGVELVLGGYDNVQNKVFLGAVTNSGAEIQDRPYICLGSSAQCCVAGMRECYNPEMNEEQAGEALQMCLSVVKKRSPVALSSSCSLVKIDCTGVHRLADLEL